MAEENNMESNNLCAPEDAFDQFQHEQSTSLEEDEYITLADIVPPEPTAPYLQGDPNEIPYDNEVILTNLDDRLSDANSQSSQLGFEDSYSVDRAHLNVSDDYLGAELTIGGQDNEDYQETPEPEPKVEPKTSADSTHNKRGRRSNKTPAVSAPSDDSLLVEKSSEAPTSVSKRGRKRIPKQMILIDLPPPTAPKRRGRPKKSAPKTEPQVSNENKVSYQDDCDEDDMSLSNFSKERSSRRSVSKKALQQEVSLEQNISNGAKTKVAKKRGRKKKVPDVETANGVADLHPEPQRPGFDDLEEIPVHTITNFKALQNDTQIGEDIKDQEVSNEFGDPDDLNDNVSLSNLKNSLDQNIVSIQENIEGDIKDNVMPSNTDTSKPLDEDFGHSINGNTEGLGGGPCLENGEQTQPYLIDPNQSLLVEDTSKRPKRQRVKQKLVYEQDSDEDPFANVELSDDEPKKKKGKRYYSDDEYVPGKKAAKSSSDASDSDIDLDEGVSKRKKFRKNSSTTRSPRKTPAKQHFDEIGPDVAVTTVTPRNEKNPDQVDDIEGCLQSSVIKAPEEAIKKAIWGSTSEFENFIANKIQTTSDLKIKKVSSDKPVTKSPIQIPVLKPEVKKRSESWTQTHVYWKSTGVQTAPPSEIPMKDNVKLTKKQSENACNFLKSVVGTTSELGTLMTQKSDEFITKRINTDNVTDTFKMDYCVKKSFLLLKLAKHNILHMEEDLSKKYEDFLAKNNLLKHREQPKEITAKVKDADDSDCEIVGETVPGPSKAVSKESNAKFNPKTVFLNKELSIKIAKKEVKPEQAQNCKDKLNIKGRHTVWISDSVMVKKVKPTQSFLAQDSRNKKPPDSKVTEKMVSDFFKNYYHAKVLSKCAQFTSAEWLQIDKNNICCYYFVKPDEFRDSSARNGEARLENTEIGESASSSEGKSENEVNLSSPDSLFSLCTRVLQKQLKLMRPDCVEGRGDKASNDIADVRGSTDPMADVVRRDNPRPLFRLCQNTLTGKHKGDIPNLTSSPDQLEDKEHPKKMLTLKEMCSAKLLPFFSFVRESQICSVENVEALAENVDFKEHQASGKVLSPKEMCSAKLLPLCSFAKESQNCSVENVRASADSVECNKHQAPRKVSSLKELCSTKLLPIFSSMGKSEQHPTREFEASATNDSITNIVDHPIDRVDEDLIDDMLKDPIYDMSDEDDTFDTAARDLIDKKVVQNTQESWPSEISYNDPNVAVSTLDHRATSSTSTLFSLCVQLIQRKLDTCLANDLCKNADVPAQTKYTPSSLHSAAFESVKHLLYNSFVEEEKQAEVETKAIEYRVKTLAQICLDVVSQLTANDYNCQPTAQTSVGMTINCVNTMTEEAFHNIQEAEESQDGSQFLEDGDSTFYNDEFDQECNDVPEESQTEDNTWLSQVQMEVNSINQFLQEEDNGVSNEQPVLARIKAEPIEEPTENLAAIAAATAIIKTETLQNPDQMTIFPDGVLTKMEQNDETHANMNVSEAFLRQNSSSFDCESFEAFVQTNKTTHPLDESSSDGIFSQSAYRVRRQFEPDYRHEADEFDPMSLLVPQTFEPLTIETAKGHLMESSSDESSKGSAGKKKPEKRGRKPKKAEAKTKEVTTSKEKPPSASAATNELAVLTRKMRERIRQEEKKVESSDSEAELPLSNRRDKTRKDATDKNKQTNKAPENEIQVNDVDSTEQTENTNQCEISPSEKFSGFTAVDQNEITSYQKYVQYVYNKILPEPNGAPPGKTAEEPKTIEAPVANQDDERPESPLIDYEDPVEMLECEPTMPIFDDDDHGTKRPKRTEPRKAKGKTEKAKPVKEKVAEAKPVYIEKDGWHCYPIPHDETKLYQKLELILEKLPETFVETYFKYQDITVKQIEDEDINRLINLHTLNRSNAKDVKSRKKSKGKGASDDNASGAVSRADSPDADHYAELTPSEDEGANIEDVLPPPVRQTSENILAKSSLMDENGSDTDTANETNAEETESKKRSKKSKKLPPPPAENLMLTADKSLNKELNLLHAPVILKHDFEDVPTRQSARKHKTGHRSSSARDRARNDDDSSSEEEKQWVTTKEKLLKRMGKKDTASLDDAKRAKLVTEFIERRGDAPESSSRKGRGKKNRRGARFLEREKQLRVLSNELYDNTTLGQKKFSRTYFKGRRNIRKVIDKKSLARSTVVANMEEFERKCRLNHRQGKLRELLGLEEGVNVVVINDEVCLEYDFEEQEPVVTVHPFFTKVMKAHQYEGVKFMWDACFESLAKVEAGGGGGGCILAHCMGLGKTLQVLALLHTVLTHPRVGMQRVLVCCPLSTVLNWVDEINKWIGPVTDQIKVFELSKLKKTYERAYQLEDWYNGGGIFIIGYELFRSMTTLDPEYDDVRPTIVKKIRTALLDPGPDIIVCDEGHLLKNDCSVLAVAMSRVATKRRIVLTGTPMQNNLREYYCMVNFVKPNLLGTYSEYSNRFENPIMNGQHRDSREEDIKLMKQRTHILHKVLEGCLQRQEASVLYPYLPKKHEYTLFISLTQCQWELYRHYLQNYGKENSKQSILRDFHILQKIWSHPKVLHNFQMRARDNAQAKFKPEKLEDDLAHEDLESEDIKPPAANVDWWTQYLDAGNMLHSLESSNKFVVVFRILDECISLGDKVLIFSTSLITMDVLEYFLKNINGWSLGHEYYRLDGSVPPEVRQKWCREFNAEHNLKTKVFLISTRAGSLGLNMVAANRVIILDTSWNPAHDIQSIFRVYRFGQKKDCYIYRLVAMGTMEQKIYERSVTKQAVACRVVDEQQIDRHYNMAELTELYKYDESGTSVAGGVAVGVTDVALLRVARLPALHAVHEHDSLLRGSSEQELPDHERAAAWMQFQQEQADKQMQNQLTSSLSLHIPRKTLPGLYSGQVDPQYSGYSGLSDIVQYGGASLLQPPPTIKAETPDASDASSVAPTYSYLSATTAKKGKTGPQVLKVNIPIDMEGAKPPKRLSRKEALALEEATVSKIMNLLIKHDFQGNKSQRDIAALVSSVRKIVAYGQVPVGTFNPQLTQSIANVLLGKEPDYIPPDPPKPTRGRPRKQDLKLLIKPLKRKSPPPTEPLPPEYIGRRRAAIAAEKNLSSAIGSIVDLDSDGGSANEDWQGANSDSDYTEEAAPQKPKAPTPAVKTVVKTEKPMTVTSGDMINLLSDDDEPPQVANTKKDAPKPQRPEDVIPLHPSLLTNENFIKIVAYTYLEGNPMLDNDAANMAAQYSTTKALKELESTGKPIVSGPIYDIAVQHLGKDVLAKVHKKNPPLKPPTTRPEVKQEPAGPSRVMLKAKGIAELMVKQETKAKHVVPISLFKTEENVRRPQATTPAPASQESQRGECILPDDDDVVFTDKPATKAVTAGRKNSQPLILNAVLAKSEFDAMSKPGASKKPTIIKIKRGGQVVVSKAVHGNAMTKQPEPQPPVTRAKIEPTPQASNQDTICLDSDEEVSPPPVPAAKEPKRKMVAMKSTAKLAKQQKAQPVPVALTKVNQGRPTPVSLTAVNQGQPTPVALTAVHQGQPTPVPGSLTAANRSVFMPMPHASTNQSQPVPVALTASSQANMADNMAAMNQYGPQFYQQMQQPMMMDQMQNSNYFMIPVSQMNQMTQSGLKRIVVPSMDGQAQPGMVTTPGGSLVFSTPQGVRYMNPMPQGMMTSVPQGVMMNAVPQNMMSALPQHTEPASASTTPPTNAPPRNLTRRQRQMAQNAAAPAEPAKSAPAAPSKTVCKPGDILRITETGEVEILNSSLEKPSPAPKPAEKESQARPASRKVGPLLEERTRKVSSSSSSGSDSSRASSPEPLSIFKDVVQIRSVEDILQSSKSKGGPTNKPSPSTSKTAPKQIDSKALLGSKGNKREPPKPKPPAAKPASGRDNASIIKQINKTDTILKRLDSVLGFKGEPEKRPGKPALKTAVSNIELVDLDDDDAVVFSKPTKQPAKRQTSRTQSPATPSKLIGTSKNIIISGSGKASLDKSSVKKNIQVTNVEIVPPQKKRQAPSTVSNATKKKRNEPMTLKDFNIDDIDDIIELE